MYDTIGKRIKFLRESHQLTQSELAAIAGVSNRAVSSWELDIKEPRMGAIEKMSIYFGIRKTDIIDGSDYLFNPTRIVLDEKERQFIDQYRKLTDVDKQMVLKFVLFLNQMEK